MVTIIPIYTTDGDCPAYLGYPYIFNTNGDWIAFVTEDRSVYSVQGKYIGWITNDPRIVRKVSDDDLMERLKPPKTPEKVKIIRSTTIPPMMSDLPNSQIDVLQDEPYKFFSNK